MNATKEQERKALKKIKNIVDEVGGADSYIGMAFEGCFELAEQNINDDAAFSMKNRFENAKLALDTKVQELEQYRKAVGEEHFRAEAAERELHVSCIRKDDLQAIRYFLTEQIEATQGRISRAAENIVANIERQDSCEYINACETIKESKIKLSQYKKLLSNLAEIKGVK